jgi:hypothetical protein
MRLRTVPLVGLGSKIRTTPAHNGAEYTLLQYRKQKSSYGRESRFLVNNAQREERCSMHDLRVYISHYTR